MNIDIVILAAGKGTRMKSALPKVLHKLAGKNLLNHVIDAAHSIDSSKLHIVVGHQAKAVEQAIDNNAINWIEQTEQLGTGHAVQQALPNIDTDGKVLILYGDVPLITPETLQTLVNTADESTLALLTVSMDDPTGYGRIIRDSDSNVVGIVEHKDASEAQHAIAEVNTGILALNSDKLHEWLPQLNNDNSQQEYYLTDIIAMAANAGIVVKAVHPNSVYEVQGVNDRCQLNELERWYQLQRANNLMLEGVTLADPARVDVRGTLTTGKDVIIDINAIFEGRVDIADNVVIGPNVLIRNSSIGAGTHIEANTVIEDAVIENSCTIGPFARIRPGTKLEDGAKVGNFVETKKSTIGKGAKVNHLTYIGDAEIGAGTNIGAGTITCNYDGVNKFKTNIGKNVFIGSNSSLVAPVNISDNATVGAGSTVTKDINEGELAIGRGKQKNIRGWARPSKK